MATYKATPADIPKLDEEIASYQKQADEYQQKLNQSPTALGGDGTPTSFDISNQQQLEKIKNSLTAAKDSKLKAQWYPAADPAANSASSEGETGAKPGLIGSALDYLQGPGRIVAGAVKHFAGQGTGTLGEDIKNNLQRDKSTFGDILKTSNVPYAIAAPLGFALDIALDPVNWATAGTAALVPKIGLGLAKGAATGGVKGAIKGLSLGAEAGALEKIAGAGKFIPFVNKTGGFANLATRSVEKNIAYEGLTDTGIEKMITKRGFGIGESRALIGESVERIVKTIPGGEKVLESLKYDPNAWVRRAQLAETIEKAGMAGDARLLDEIMAAERAGQDATPMRAMYQKITAERRASTPPINLIDWGENAYADVTSQKNIDAAMQKLGHVNLDKKMAADAGRMVSSADDAASLLKNPELGRTFDSAENFRRIAAEKSGLADLTWDEIGRAVKSDVFGDTGVKWYDDTIDSIRKFKLKINVNGERVFNVGQKFLDGSQFLTSMFKVAKVPGSPAAWTNAVAGNYAFMHMIGLADDESLVAVKRAWDGLKNKTGAAVRLDDMLGNATGDATRQWLASNSKVAEDILGDVSFAGARANATMAITAAKEHGIIPNDVEIEGLQKGFAGALAKINMFKEEEMARLAKTMSPEEATKKGLKGMVSGGLEGIKKRIKNLGTQVSSSDLGTGFMGNNVLDDQTARRVFDRISEEAAKDPKNVVWKSLDFFYNKLPNGYEKIDQSFKLGTFIKASSSDMGLTKNQLLKVRHYIELDPADITEAGMRNGQRYWSLSPQKALELSNVAYMNYAAMPAAVKIMKNIPFLNSPFASFMYGMTVKTGQTLAYNPSVFNKINYAMNDFGGQKTPLEKKALAGPYYSHLNAPGMFRMPFFEKNPMYINLANAIPYYSMNMFNPSQVNYQSDGIPAKLVQAVQQSPFIKDPVWATIFNYVVQPAILGESIAPQGQFGQALYPVNAGFGTKAMYAARDTAEAFVPTGLEFAGLVTPEAAAPYAPLYRWRSLAEAMQGKNAIGISSKEPVSSRVGRGVAGALGVPIQASVNTTFTQGQQ